VRHSVCLSAAPLRQTDRSCSPHLQPLYSAKTIMHLLLASRPCAQLGAMHGICMR
jgi:hypothetical protein